MSREHDATEPRHGDQSDEVPEELLLAFAPIHKRAFGLAVGTALGGLLALATIVATLFPEGRAGGLALLSQYFVGYTVSWTGALVGFAWAGFAGFVVGWFTAFCRNLMIAVQIWYGRTKQELRATHDFLDHI